MDTAKSAMLVGAFRTIMGGLLGWVVAKQYIPGDVLNTILLAVGTIGLCVWSLSTKQGPAQEWYPYLLGAGRNILSVALTYASGKGWIAPADVAPMLAAFGTIAVSMWSIEAKYLSVGVRRVAAFVLVGLLFPAFLMGCASNPITGADPQQTVYNIGETALGPLSTADTLVATGLIPIPSKVCAALGSLSVAYNGAENTVRSTTFQNGSDWDKANVALTNALAVAVGVIAELALNAHEPVKMQAHKPLLVTADPSDSDWTTLNGQLSADIQAVKCL